MDHDDPRQDPRGVLLGTSTSPSTTSPPRYANDTLRVTTRQCFQLHYVLKGDLKKTIRSMNDALITTLGACGDVERNLMACPAPTIARPSRSAAFAH